MDYYIEISTPNKAKKDIDTINRCLGYVNLVPEHFGNGGAARFFTKLLAMFRILSWMKQGDILFLQYPMKKFYKLACILAHARGAKVVTIIHDLGAFRRHKLTPEQENRRLAKTDFIIAHNETMKQHLIKYGYKGGINTLGIFDYLSNRKIADYDGKAIPWKIVYAGNLGKWRNKFLYNIDIYANNWNMDLYGNGFIESEFKGEHLHYHGYIDSNDFIEKVKAHFGLVWDGDTGEECSGAWGSYLMINNPHKTSFYLRAGIPVIVWSKAAMAQFVKDNNLGLVIDTLYDIDKMLSKLTIEEYETKKAAAVRMSKLLNDGHFIKEKLQDAHKFLEKER